MTPPTPPRPNARGWRFGDASRARRRRHSALAQGLLAAAPWLDVLVICGLLAFVGQRYLLQPGVAFELPASPLGEGALTTLPSALLLPLEDNAVERGAWLHFEDLRFQAGRPGELQRFAETLRVHAALGGEILLLADARVAQEWVMAAALAARQGGITRVNVATRPVD